MEGSLYPQPSQLAQDNSTTSDSFENHDDSLTNLGKNPKDCRRRRTEGGDDGPLPPPPFLDTLLRISRK